MSQAAPTPPLDELLVEPELPLDPELPLEPELELEELELELVSGAAASGVVWSWLFGGSFTPASGAGSVDLVSSVVAPSSPASGEVAHAAMRATSDRLPRMMRVERRMAGTVEAELCMALGRLSRETLR